MMKKKIYNFFYQFTFIYKPEYWFLGECDMKYSKEIDELLDELLDKYTLNTQSISGWLILGTVELRPFNGVYYILEFPEFRPSRRVVERINKTLDTVRHNKFKDKINKLKS